MKQSDTIGALALALSKVQGEIQNLHKDKAGYGYKYAELSSILDEARPLLSKHQLALVQLCCNTIENHDIKPDVVGIHTVLMHSSGEWISGSFFMPVHASKGMSLAQAAGSISTYCRRYSLAAVLGIAQTDNDANIKEEPKVDPIWTQAMDKLLKLVAEKGLEDRLPIWANHFKLKSIDDLTESQIKQLITRIEEAN